MNQNDRVVITFDKTSALRSECKYIKGAYYKKDSQCFLMSDNKWHRINNGLIEFDHEIKKYVLKESVSLQNGLVAIEGNNLIFGYFSRNKSRNCSVFCHRTNSRDRNTYVCLDSNIVENSDLFIEDLSSGIFVQKTYCSDFHSSLSRFSKKGISSRYSVPLDYKASYRMKEYINEFHKNFEPKIIETSLHKELPDITFGVEFETYDGFIPEYKTLKNGLIPVRDGSLRHDGISPFEFATIPHKGFTGIAAFKECTDLLKKYCVNSTLGSTHIHIGNKPVSKEYALSMFMLAINLEDEIYEMFSQEIRHTESFKPKSYCNPLPRLRLAKTKDVDYNFNILFKYLAGGDYTFHSFGDEHPQDESGNHKWQVGQRYLWFNIIPLIFGGRGTNEFRLHTSTFSYEKITLWLFITSAIVEYGFKNRNEISSFKKDLSKIKLSNIMNEIYSPLVANLLNDYIQYRKDIVKKYATKGDYIGQFDVNEKTDNIDEFKSLYKSLI